MTYFVAYLLGGSLATQSVSLAYPISGDADVQYVADMLRSSHADGRTVHVVAWSEFAPSDQDKS